MSSPDARDALLQRLRQTLEAGEMLDAAEVAQELVAESRRLGDPADYCAAEALSLIGQVRAEHGFADGALDALEEADVEWKRYPDEAFKLRWLARNSQFRAVALNALGRHSEAISAAEYALIVYRRALRDVNDPVSLEPEEALDLIGDVLSEFRHADSEAAEALGTLTILLVRTYSTIARACLRSGDVMLALPWLDVTYRAIERVDQAQRPIVHAEAFAVHHDLAMTAMILVEAGTWTEETLPPAVAEAVDRWDALSELDLSLSDVPGAGSFDARLLMVQADMRSGRDDDAHAALDTMLADFGKDDTKRAAILTLLAQTKLRLDGSLDQLQQNAVEAMQIAERLGDEGRIIVALNQAALAELALRRNILSDATRWAASSIATIVPLTSDGSLHAAADQLRQLAQAYRAAGNPAAGVFFAKLTEGVMADVYRRVVRTLPVVPADGLPNGHRDAADRLRGYLIEDGRLGEALTAGLLPPDDTPLPMTPLEAELARRFAQRASDAAEADRTARELARAETSHAVSWATLQQEQLERFRDVIPWQDGTVFLHYNPLAEGLQIVIASSDHAESWLVPVGAAELSLRAFGFLQALVNQTFVESSPWDLLIRPVAEHLERTGARRLVISAADFLRFLPFAALHDGQRYLVERYALLSWSPPVAGALKQPPGRDTRVALLGYKHGRGAHAHDELLSVPEELLAIETVCRKGGRVVLPQRVDEDFDLQALAAAVGGQADVVHLATHFGADPADTEKAYLVLGDDTVIDLSDIAGFTAAGGGLDLLTLAACSTGLPVARAADANVSAAATLHAAGARSVVSTLWDVHSVSTTHLMSQFYDALFGATPYDKAEALRHAQLALLHGDAAESHPYYWAPFVLSGNWLPFLSHNAAP